MSIEDIDSKNKYLVKVASLDQKSTDGSFV